MEQLSTPPQQEQERTNERKRPRRQCTRTPLTKESPQPPLLDWSDVPHAEPIRKSDRATLRFADNSRARPTSKASRVSQYVGVYWDFVSKKWHAQIMIQGVIQNLGGYSSEREAGIVYAKAAIKYKPSAPPRGVYGGLDLRNVPEQPLILQDPGRKTLYKGVKRNKQRWEARITIPEKRMQTLGTFDTQEEAAQIYAKARYILEMNAAEMEPFHVTSSTMDETVSAILSREEGEKERETDETTHRNPTAYIKEETDNTITEEPQGHVVRVAIVKVEGSDDTREEDAIERIAAV
jgi:AP2 domain